VRRLAADFLARYARLDVLVNNVGQTLLDFQSTVDGLEMTWALNYLNHFLLTRLLEERLVNTAASQGEARVLEIVSSIYRIAPPRFQQRQQARGYNGVMAYAQSKRAQLVFALELARRFNSSGVTVNAVTPGFVLTNIAAGVRGPAALAMKVVRRFSLQAEEGVKPILHLAGSPDARGISGGYYQRFQALRPVASVLRPEIAAELWQISLDQTGE
jgi:NAD(P)-dependent dehydrogenase (short-subunit alcohol dehydrogenase family)